MSRRHEDDAHGVTDRERQVLDRSDAGMAASQIAAETGMSRNYVDWLIRKYAISDRTERRWINAAVLANQAYLAAVAVTGKTFA